MPDTISPEQHRSQITALNREIYMLNVRLNDMERSRIPDSRDPFRNPTEYHESQAEYTDVLPQLTYPGYTVPLDPEQEERKRLKRIYAVGGGCMLAHFVLSDYIISALYVMITAILRSVNPDAGTEAIRKYISASSIFAGLTMIVYLLANVGFARLGMRLTNKKHTELFRTRNFTPAKAAQYTLIGIFLLLTTALISAAINDLFSKYGYNTNVLDLDGVAVSNTGKAVMLIYTVIIAPVTEEYFFRGMLLHCFSKANQRFAVFFSAFFFGLAHANIPQFLLAFTLGIFLAHITLLHGSIVPSIIVHICVNSTSTIFSEFNFKGSALLVANEILLILAILGGIMLLIFRSDNKIPATTPAQTRRGLSLALATPIVTLTLILQMLYLFSLIFQSPLLNIFKNFL